MSDDTKPFADVAARTMEYARLSKRIDELHEVLAKAQGDEREARARAELARDRISKAHSDIREAERDLEPLKRNLISYVSDETMRLAEDLKLVL